MSIEAMKQALEKATEVMEAACIRVDELKAENESLRQAIAEAEKQAYQQHQINQLEKLKGHILENAEELGVVLDEAEKQEPVAWAQFSEIGNLIDLLEEPCKGYVPLYTHPQPKREWVGLTDEQIISIAYDCNALPEVITDKTLIDFVRALEIIYGITSDMKQEPVAKTAKQRHEENT